jgi:hypothetical protein
VVVGHPDGPEALPGAAGTYKGYNFHSNTCFMR